MFNLLTNPWLPIVRQDGTKSVIAPRGITEDISANPVIAVDWPRADFRLATMELLAGLIATACPPADEDDWLDAWEAPPSPEKLDGALAPLSHAFSFDGPGPRFMQDLADLDADEEPVENLLIEVAGNSGPLVHPGRTKRMGRPAAAISLYTLQSWSPSGGRGNRTGLRGGGPMVTMVAPGRHRSLWHHIWANVPLGRKPETADLPRVFPWLSPTITSVNDEVVTPDDVAHPLQVWWGMPRRIRLSFVQLPSPAPCDLTGALDSSVVTGWRQRPHGPKYVGWGARHPLTPTYQNKAGEEILSVHPNPGGVGYRNWIGLVLRSPDGLRRPAPIVSTWRNDRYRGTEEAKGARLIAGGYDTDNMKARGFMETEVPLVLASSKEVQERLDALATSLVRASERASYQLRKAVQQALYHPGAKVKATAHGIALLGDRVWLETESAFFSALDRAMSLDDTAPERVAWQVRLRGLALRIFDDTVPIDPLDRNNARQVRARFFLGLGLSGYGKDGQSFFQILEMPLPAQEKKSKGKAS